MQAAVFEGPGRIALRERPRPHAGPGEAVVRVTTTTICGTDIHILRGEYPVAPGLIVGHEMVGVIAELGAGMSSYAVGQRVITGAITPCGQCHTCLDGHQAQCGGLPMGGWRLGNTIDGCQAEYVRIPFAMANLAPVPDQLSDEQVLMCPDIMSTGFAGAENGRIRLGDTVAIFAQGPIGLCATAGAQLRGASRILVVDAIPARLAVATRLGADHAIDLHTADPVAEILRLTDGRGADVAIEALGTEQTFLDCLRVLRPGGTLSSLGVYSGKLSLPAATIAAGLGDHTLVTTLCPGGKERMRRLMTVVASGRVDLTPLVTHRFRLAQVADAYELFAAQRDGVLKVAICPG
jgi:threonine dehydrogenase-like Zn-dependent dehydrogenase